MNLELRRDLLLAALALIVFQMLIAFGAIGLLGRMSPEIERILEDNVVSIEASEVMLAALASEEGGMEGRSRRFRRALDVARENVTEVEEEGVLAVIEPLVGEALAGPGPARERVITELGVLSRTNREAMEAADARAKRLGMAGAWATVFVAFIGFMASFFVLVRIRRRILDPIDELYSVFEALSRGEPFRRCHLAEAPEEVRALMLTVNSVLDRWMGQTPRVEATHTGEDLRAALLAALDQHPAPLVVVREGGQVVAANSLALDRLAAPDGVELRRSLAEPEAAGPAAASRIGAGPMWIVRL